MDKSFKMTYRYQLNPKNKEYIYPQPEDFKLIIDGQRVPILRYRAHPVDFERDRQSARDSKIILANMLTLDIAICAPEKGKGF